MSDERPQWVRLGLWGIASREAALGFATSTGVVALALLVGGALGHSGVLIGMSVGVAAAASWYVAGIRWMDRAGAWASIAGRRGLTRSSSAAAVAVVAFSVAMAGGYRIGKGAGRWRADRFTMDEVAARLVADTRPNLPRDLGQGWSLEGISATPEGLALECRHGQPIPPDEVEQSVATAQADMVVTLCQNRWVMRLLQKKGRLSLTFAGAANGTPFERPSAVDIASCSPPAGGPAQPL